MGIKARPALMRTIEWSEEVLVLNDNRRDISEKDAWSDAVTRFIDKNRDEMDVGKISDGYHTFDELYHHRAILFSVICNVYRHRAWKSKLHHDGTMYDGMFIVGIVSEQGQATYHYNINPYWDMFDVAEIERAPEWDGHTPDDAIKRIQSVGREEELEELEKCYETIDKIIEGETHE